MSALSLPSGSSGFPFPALESRPAFALVVALHVIAMIFVAHLVDSRRVTLRPPLIVEMLKEPEPEVKKPPAVPPPKKKEVLPEPPVIEPPPKQVQTPLPPVNPPPKQIAQPPEPVPVQPPEPPKPDTLPEPLPMAELPPPPKAVSPAPIAQAPTPPRPVEPLPVPQKVVAPVEAPPRPVAPPEMRARPQPPVRVAASSPVPVEAPRLPDPTLRVERDVPEARPVALAPREPSQRPTIERPVVSAPISAPAQVAVAEPQPQITVLPEPPAGASAEVVGEITLGAELLRATYLRNPKPLYPAASRRLKEQGTVLLRIFVTAAGHPTQISLKQSSGYERLDHAALQAVPNWKFAPATREENPVDAWVIVPIKFSLKN
ncbi:MAG TPA: TonB family protein [Burkholderiales bacterium]|nr:TonB family protein [Burkholderiales bacterium]